MSNPIPPNEGRLELVRRDALSPFITFWIGFGVCLFFYEFGYGLPGRHVGVLVVGLGVLTHLLLRAGLRRTARWTFVCLACATVCLIPINVSGARTPALAFLPVMVILAGWLLGRKPMLIVAVAMSIIVVSYAATESHGNWVPPIPVRSFSDFAIAWIGAMAVAGVVTWWMLVASEGDLKREVTLREQNDKAQENLKTLLRVMRDGILMIDRNGNVEYANEHFCKQFSVQILPEALIGMKSQELIEVIRPSYKNPDAEIARIRDLLVAGKPCIGDEVYMSSGQTLLRDFVPIEFSDGGVARLWNHRDVTSMRRAQDELEVLSNMDGLTEIANRRKFNEALPKEMLRCAREGQPLSLIMIDIDHFKNFNDRYGHVAGDECLRQVAKAIRSCVSRPSDLVGRYGGEEFYALLPGTDADGAIVIAERMRRSISSLGIEHIDSSSSKCVTVSIGVASAVSSATMQASEVLQGADSSLYKAKANGRNCVVALALN